MKNKILILDDSETWRNLIREALVKHRIDEDDILLAGHPDIAIEKLKDNCEEIAVVIVDYDLGDFHFGDDTIKKFREVEPDVYYILISDAFVGYKARSVGAGFWQKDDSISLLLELVQEALKIEAIESLR